MNRGGFIPRGLPRTPLTPPSPHNWGEGQGEGSADTPEIAVA